MIPNLIICTVSSLLISPEHLHFLFSEENLIFVWESLAKTYHHDFRIRPECRKRSTITEEVPLYQLYWHFGWPLDNCQCPHQAGSPDPFSQTDQRNAQCGHVSYTWTSQCLNWPLSSKIISIPVEAHTLCISDIQINKSV